MHHPQDEPSDPQGSAASLAEAALAAPHGYLLVNVARDGKRAVIYNAVRTSDNVEVLLKTPRNQRPTEREIAELGHELSVLTHLAGTPVAMALGMEETGSRLWLVLEDLRGQPLNRIAGRYREPTRALALGARLAGALAEVHRRGVIHLDVKPHLVIVLDDGGVRLTGFRSASLVRIDGAPRTMQGSPEYMAPEQTGRVNRPVDRRADLYALGIVLYELLTGRLPFEASDPLEWAHAHIAMVPLPPSHFDERIPSSADAIVLKLLSKRAEDRYHSAKGLQRDLERGAAALARGNTEVFELALEDAPEDFRVANGLYGREAEVARLLAGLERARSSGSCAVASVGGASGVGKTSVVGELYNGVVRERGRFITGKADQYKRDIPYATIAQAFRDLLRGLLAGGEESLGRWRERLGEALGINGRLILDVIPELARVVGPQPPVPELDPNEGRNRFELVFAAFIRVFAQPEHPLVLFLDDMQWADEATLGLLKALARPGQVPDFQLVLAFRSSEVDATHPFQLALNAMRAGASVDSMTLLELEPRYVVQLVADTMWRSPADVASLAAMVGAKTGGNPFFIGELLQALHARGLLTFDVATRGWTWDDDAIRAVEVTDNVVDLLIVRIRVLSAATRRALSVASCFGSRFDVESLAAALDEPLDVVEVSLFQALADGFVVATDDAVGARRALRFQHDRIQQAAYSFASGPERAATHLRIGRALRSRFDAGDDDVLFDAVKHLDNAISFVVDVNERQRLVELNLLAGRRAKAAIAHEPARVYLTAAESLFGDDAWTTHHPTTFAVVGELAECEFLGGRFDEAEARFVALRQRALSRAQRGNVATLQVKLYVVMGRYDEALHLGLAELTRLGAAMPATEEAVADALAVERERLSVRLAGLDLRSIVDLPIITDAEARALLGLLASLAPAVYSRRPPLFPVLAMRITNLSLEHGNCEHSCFGYSMYAMVLAGTDGEAERAFTLSEASIALNAAAIARDMLAGLHAAHGARRADGLALHVVHRDVSPQNVLVGLDGVVRVADFGVAKATRRQQHTEEGSVKGKLAYLAPEQLGGRCDLRADVFAVGAVLWELLTGTRMRTGDGVEMLVGILSGIVPAPSSVVAEAAGLDAVVLRALERCPEERFATAAAMAEAIEQSVRVASPARVAEVVRDLVATPAALSVAQADVAAHADVTSQDVISEDASNMPTAAIACGRPASATIRCARTPGPLATFRVPGPPPRRAPHRGFEPLAEPARRIARTSGAPRRAA